MSGETTQAHNVRVNLLTGEEDDRLFPVYVPLVRELLAPALPQTRALLSVATHNTLLFTCTIQY